MPPRTLASLAHALSAAPDLDATLVALGEALIEVDRSAQLALVSFDARKGLMWERLTPAEGRVDRLVVATSLEHLPSRERGIISAGTRAVDFGAQSDDVARLLALAPQAEGGWLTLQGIRFEGHLSGIVALFEPKRFFGTRTAERFAPAIALFELAYAGILEREARREAVDALEGLTQRLHGEYERKLATLEQQLLKVSAERAAAESAASSGADSSVVMSLERELAAAREAARRAAKRTHVIEEQVTIAVEQLEKLHIELHRRSETLRQKTRTLYLIERVLRLDATAEDPRALADGLLALVGDDMQSQRVSLMLRAPEPDMLYIAAARGIAPTVVDGTRTRVGEGVAGRVAASREPLLVMDVAEAKAHPLLQDQYFTTGSFISFPLVYHDELVGVVNLTNRAQHGVFVEEDVERVRLLALVIALVSARARLAERLGETLGVH
ncbi:MAG TPA: GAF domain-containing protein [Gemmatimonadaceae bacterium]|nr:GAF domain-containing protein [Gemmatimonadaceae bacterium]